MEPIGIGRGLAIPEAAMEKPQAGATAAGKFSDALNKAVNDVTQLQNTANKAITDVQTGNSGSLHEAMIALEKADISFRTMLQFRNKFIEAYQEMMRLQV